MSTASERQADRGVPTAASDRPLPSHITLRAATPEDALAMADCFFTSFWPSHKFWTLEFAPKTWHPWWVDAWRMGIEDDATMRSFLAIDTRVTEKRAQDLENGKWTGKNAVDGRIVGFVRWRIPQEDGNLNELWPDLPDAQCDTNIMGAFFGGMHKNRLELMNGEPHWFLQMLGTEQDYQGQGIGEAFVQWGCDLADKDNLPVYIDASEKGAPFYMKHFHAMPMADIPIPEKPDGFGKFTYVTHVRMRKTERETNGEAS